jgi:aminotransferase
VPELRAAVARKLKRENGIDCEPDAVLITHGACEAIQAAILGTTDPGDEVLLPDPSWSNYQGQVHMAGCKCSFFPVLEKDRFHAKAERIEKHITPKTRLLLLNSPSNPTGGVTTREELLEIAELVKERNLAVISDEPYEKLLYGGSEHVSIASLPGMEDYVFTANTFSKTYAMTGLRLGYLQGPKEAMISVAKIQEGMSSCVNTPAQWAAIEALEGPQDYVKEMLVQYTARRDLLLEGLNALPGVSCVAPEGAFYAFPNVSKLGKSQQVAEDWMKRAQLVVIPGNAFGEAGEGFLRVCFAVAEATLKEALSRLSSILEELPAK